MIGTVQLRGALTTARQTPSRSWALFLVCVSCFGISLLLARGHLLASAGLLLVVLVVGFLMAAYVVPWRRPVILLILIVLFIPIRRYVFPGSMPFALEPYRVMVALLLGLWLVALLVDSKITTVRTGLRGPLLVILLGTLASIAANPGRVGAYKSDVMKSSMFFLSFFLVLLVIVSVIRTWKDVDALVWWLAVGGTILAVLTIIEYRTNYSPFANLDHYFPFLKKAAGNEGAGDVRGGHIRPEASAEHPIALAALLVILAPLTVYLARTRSKRWFFATPVLIMAAQASLSRTAVVMTVGALLAFLWMRPSQAWRALPWLLPLLVAIKLTTPGAIGTLRYYFNPSNGLIANQSTSGGSASSGGRLTDLTPTFDQLDNDPLFGVGYGTRIRTGPRANGRILDDQWLGNLLDTGIIATLGWAWLFLRLFRRNGRAAKGDHSDRALLIVCLNASAFAFSLGMFLFDAFSFIQVTLVMFILFAVDCIALQLLERDRRNGELPAPLEPFAASG